MGIFEKTAEVRFEVFFEKCYLKRLMGNSGEIWGKTFLPGRQSIGNFGANFGGIFGHFIFRSAEGRR